RQAAERSETGIDVSDDRDTEAAESNARSQPENAETEAGRERGGASELSLRAAAESDLDAIWGIESSVFGAEAWSREMMREELTAPHRSYLALVDGSDAVLGYAGL